MEFYNQEYENGHITTIDGTLYVWTAGGWQPLEDVEDYLQFGNSSVTDFDILEELQEENMTLREELETLEIQKEELQISLSNITHKLKTYEKLGTSQEIAATRTCADFVERHKGIAIVLNHIEPHLLRRGWVPLLITPQALEEISSSSQVKTFTASYNEKPFSFIYTEGEDA
jgi:hypothetical protein